MILLDKRIICFIFAMRLVGVAKRLKRGILPLIQSLFLFIANPYDPLLH
jgi:hypothetical protein